MLRKDQDRIHLGKAFGARYGLILDKEQGMWIPFGVRTLTAVRSIARTTLATIRCPLASDEYEPRAV